MITRIEAWRYRCFEHLAVDLGEVNVLCGANGTGKTTLLDIPALLADMYRQRSVAAAFLTNQYSRPGRRAQSLDELVFQSKNLGDGFALAIEARLPPNVAAHFAEGRPTVETWRATHLRYEVRLVILDSTRIRVEEEYLYLFNDSAPPRGTQPLLGDTAFASRWVLWRQIDDAWIRSIARDPDAHLRGKTKARGWQIRVPADRLALASMPFDVFDHPEIVWLTNLLEEGAVFFEPDGALLRSASPPGQPLTLSRDGMSAVWLAKHLQDTSPDAFTEWTEHVRTALPQIENIRVLERQEDHHAYFRVRYQGGYEVTSSGLSDGTLRIMLLTLPAWLPEAIRPTLMITEEPENGIHPKGIETVLQSLNLGPDHQVWYSTHSPVVLAHVPLESVLCMRRVENGAITIVRGDNHPRMVEWQDAVDLPSMFASGVLD
jgi:predicted ATPase